MFIALLRVFGVSPTAKWGVFFHAVDSLLLGVLTAVVVTIVGYLSTYHLSIDFVELTHIAEAAAVGAFVKGYPSLVQPFENAVDPQAVDPDITKPLPALKKNQQ